MAIVLTDSVGIRGENLSPDVLQIQETLNRVPSSDGGPAVPLELDGICGSKTKEAIQKFQLHHFGWGGADGLVEVHGQTHLKLNTYTPTTPKPTPVPPVPPRPREPKAARFVLLREYARDSMGYDLRDYYFEIRSVPHNFGHIYFLQVRRPLPIPQPPPTRFSGGASLFTTRTALDTSEFSGHGFYLTQQYSRDNISSSLTLQLKSGRVVIEMDTHLIGPHGIIYKTTDPHSQKTATWQEGPFILISRSLR